MELWKELKESLLTHKYAMLSDENRNFTYLEFMDKAERIGDKLRIFLPRKSKCLIKCSNNFNTAVSLLSCWAADLIPIVTSDHYGENHCKNIADLTSPDVIISDNCNYFEEYPVFSLYAGNVTKKPEIKEIEPELFDLAAIMCTSGTTGKPKGAMITEKGLIENLHGIKDYFRIKANDSILIARPLYHCAVMTGEFLISLIKGLNIRFYDGIYSPAEITKILDKYNISVMCGTPTLINHIASYYSLVNRTSGVKKMALSGECLPEIIAYKIKKVFKQTDIYNVYGLTEASPRVSYLPPELFEGYPESVGIGLPKTSIKIIDSEGKEAPANTPGNVWISSPSLMKGYYRDKENTERVLKYGGLISGDIGYIDKRGYLYILSRADDMIIKSGMNIYPQEVEQEILKAEQIKEVVVYGKKKNFGEEIAADIVLKNKHSSVTEKEIRETLSSILPDYQMPRIINFIDIIEKNASGKVVRRK